MHRIILTKAEDMGNKQGRNVLNEESATVQTRRGVSQRPVDPEPLTRGACGHSVRTLDVLAMVNSCLSKKSLEFSCPVCGHSWDWVQIRGLIQQHPTEMDALDARVDAVIQDVPELYKKCHICAQILRRPLDSSGQASPSALCPHCPRPRHFCWACLSPWLFSLEAGPGQCGNRSCGPVAMLLTCGTVTDPDSSVLGCPEFRACPSCKSLIMHTSEGCKYVDCLSCSYHFCYICLREGTECLTSEEGSYLAGFCVGARIAKRQRFVT